MNSHFIVRVKHICSVILPNIGARLARKAIIIISCVVCG